MAELAMSDPLGAPKMVTGPEYLNALAGLGYNMENLSSPIPLMTKIAQNESNLLDMGIKNRQAYQQAQADLAYKTAQTQYTQSEADYNNQSLGDRLNLLKANVKDKQAEADYNSGSVQYRIDQQRITRDKDAEDLRHAQENNPVLEQENKAKSQQADILTKEMQDEQQRDQQALKDYPLARALLPTDPNDPDFEDKIAHAYEQYPEAMTNRKTKPLLDTAITGVVNQRNSLASIQAQRQEMAQIAALKSGGNLPLDTNVDDLNQNPTARHDAIVRGNVTATQRRLSEVLSLIGPNPPAELARYVDDMQNAQNRITTILGQPDAVNQIKTGNWSQFFDVNGNLNPGLEGDIKGVENYTQERIKQGLAKPMTTDVTVADPTDPSGRTQMVIKNVPIGHEAEARAHAQEFLKTTSEKAKGAAEQKAGKPSAQAQKVAQLYRTDPVLSDLAAEAQRTGDWSKVQAEVARRLEAEKPEEEEGREGMQDGGQVPGVGSTDTVPAMLTPGEYVVNKAVAQDNLPLLEAMNQGQIGIPMQEAPPHEPLPLPAQQQLAPVSFPRPDLGTLDDKSPRAPALNPATAGKSSLDVAATQARQAVSPAASASTASTASTSTAPRMFLNPATGSYEPLQSTEPLQSAHTSGGTVVRGTEFGEIDRPSRGGYTEPGWNRGTWGDNLEGQTNEGVALPSQILSKYGNWKGKGFATDFNNKYDILVTDVKTGKTVRAPLKDAGPGAKTGAGIDLLWGTRANLGLPSNSSYAIRYSIVPKSRYQQGGLVTDPAEASQASQDVTTMNLLAAQSLGQGVQGYQWVQGYQDGGLAVDPSQANLTLGTMPPPLQPAPLQQLTLGSAGIAPMQSLLPNVQRAVPIAQPVRPTAAQQTTPNLPAVTTGPANVNLSSTTSPLGRVDISGLPMLRGLAYGPGSEGATAADQKQLIGARNRQLRMGDLAVSPNQLDRYPIGSHAHIADKNGNIVLAHQYIADRSMYDAKHPTKDTFEIWGGRSLGPGYYLVPDTGSVSGQQTAGYQEGGLVIPRRRGQGTALYAQAGGLVAPGGGAQPQRTFNIDYSDLVRTVAANRASRAAQRRGQATGISPTLSPFEVQRQSMRNVAGGRMAMPVQQMLPTQSWASASPAESSSGALTNLAALAGSGAQTELKSLI